MEPSPFVVAQAPASDQATFYRRTYGLVAISFTAFAALLALSFVGFDTDSGLAAGLMKGLLGMVHSMGRWAILLVMLAFWLATTLAQGMAFSRASRQVQYAGLGLYVALEALIFIPLIAYVIAFTHGHASQILVPAGIVTGALIVGLTAAVFMTTVDFSFLRVAIVIGSLCMLGVILVAAIAGLSLGTWFSIAMILLMASVILYQTYVIKNTLETDQYIAAAFVLFSSFVTLLFYVIRFFLGRRDD